METASVTCYFTGLRLVHCETCSIVAIRGYGFNVPCNIFPVQISIVSVGDHMKDSSRRTFGSLALASFYGVEGEFSLVEEHGGEGCSGCISFLDPSVNKRSIVHFDEHERDTMRALIIQMNPEFYCDYDGIVTKYKYFVNSSNEIEIERDD